MKKIIEKETFLTVINANARSLEPKFESLSDCMEEKEASLSVVTETWLGDEDGICRDTTEIGEVLGLDAVYRNREKAPNGVNY